MLVSVTRRFAECKRQRQLSSARCRDPPSLPDARQVWHSSAVPLPRIIPALADLTQDIAGPLPVDQLHNWAAGSQNLNPGFRRGDENCAQQRLASPPERHRRGREPANHTTGASMATIASVNGSVMAPTPILISPSARPAYEGSSASSGASAASGVMS